MELLLGAWESRAPKKVNAVVLHALGGAGKSALLRTFANELLAAGGGGASRKNGLESAAQAGSIPAYNLAIPIAYQKWPQLNISSKSFC
jgi:hypothetical protein